MGCSSQGLLLLEEVLRIHGSLCGAVLSRACHLGKELTYIDGAPSVLLLDLTSRRFLPVVVGADPFVRVIISGALSLEESIK